MQLLLIPKKYHPDEPYATRVSISLLPPRAPQNTNVTLVLAQEECHQQDVNICLTDVCVSGIQVSTGRMHLYTAIQIVCLATLWLVKSSQVSLALPFILILTIPLRMFMTGRLFTQLEMKCVS